MGKGRAPCCEKSRVKKGHWTPEEDTKLVTHIRQFGHPNWRSLPAKAGLLRCGKSCRLRWINYLRPDVKRGNFTLEEEETILNLHKEHGNKWSKIASLLPGRTDNEIKNIWNTHLKKRFEAKDDSIKSNSVSSSSSTTTTSVSPAKDDKECSMSSNAERLVTGEKAKEENFAHDMEYSLISNQERHNNSIEQVTAEKMKQENFAEIHDDLAFQATPSDLDMEFWYTLEDMGSIFSHDDIQNLNFWERTC